ncbi:hypothetical protein [Limosilactobacillus reuteri]|nr:hypothetical protein [Limosilactobacillus reuteri]
MDDATEEQYHHSVDILIEKYKLGFISLDELDHCLHWTLDDLFLCLEKP